MSDTLPSNPVDRQKIKDAINEIVDSYTRTQAERDLVNEICARIKDELEFSPKELRKQAKVRYNRNLEELKAQAAVTEEIQSILFKDC